MREYDDAVLQCFLENQSQLFPEDVADSMEEAEAFLEDCMAVVVDSAEEVEEYFEETGVDTDRVYYNAHGTGTHMNDLAETIAIKKALGEERARKIAISSTKSMTGHMLGAAGAVEAIASVLALRDGIVPPTIGLTDPDPACDLDNVPLTARKAELDIALSASLGFGGHNACLAFKKAD